MSFNNDLNSAALVLGITPIPHSGEDPGEWFRLVHDTRVETARGKTRDAVGRVQNAGAVLTINVRPGELAMDALYTVYNRQQVALAAGGQFTEAGSCRLPDGRVARWKHATIVELPEMAAETSPSVVSWVVRCEGVTVSKTVV